MQTSIKINDTLRITNKQGFPVKALNLERHLKKPYTLKDLKNRVFTFTKPLPRIYCLPPTRTFLVQEINGKWVKWGHCLIVEQTIYNGKRTTGKFIVSKIYDPEYMKMATINDTPNGKSYF
ncbi:MAG: hypothetical protein WC687_05045 [Patescibacteria group bacterium]|jgi:hypothetical protein